MLVVFAAGVPVIRIRAVSVSRRITVFPVIMVFVRALGDLLLAQLHSVREAEYPEILIIRRGDNAVCPFVRFAADVDEHVRAGDRRDILRRRS